jgi:hypothetical protein
MLTVTLLIALAAFVCAVLAALGRAPLWVAVILLTVALLLQVLPR